MSVKVPVLVRVPAVAEWGAVASKGALQTPWRLLPPKTIHWWWSWWRIIINGDGNKCKWIDYFDWLTLFAIRYVTAKLEEQMILYIFLLIFLQLLSILKFFVEEFYQFWKGRQIRLGWVSIKFWTSHFHFANENSQFYLLMLHKSPMMNWTQSHYHRIQTSIPDMSTL